MANSDYTIRPQSNGYCPSATLNGSLAHLATTLYYSSLLTSFENPIKVGDAILIDDEIMGIYAFTETTISVNRGCCDTIPAAHSSGARIWFFDASTAYDYVEYAPTETIGVKLIPQTLGRGPMPIEGSPPNELIFNWRFARPYPPGRVNVNGDPWFDGAPHPLNGTTDPFFTLTWRHRDRVLQQDQLIEHAAGNIGPEAGTTYRIKVYTAGNTLVRTIDLAGSLTEYEYTQVAALTDMDCLDGTANGYLRLMSVRDSLESLYSYKVDFTVDSGLPAQPNGLGYRLGRFLGGFPA